MSRTVLDVASLDLLQDFGPDSSVDLLILVDKLGLQLNDLGETSARMTNGC